MWQEAGGPGENLRGHGADSDRVSEFPSDSLINDDHKETLVSLKHAASMWFSAKTATTFCSRYYSILSSCKAEKTTSKWNCSFSESNSIQRKKCTCSISLQGKKTTKKTASFFATRLDSFRRSERDEHQQFEIKGMFMLSIKG